MQLDFSQQLNSDTKISDLAGTDVITFFKRLSANKRMQWKRNYDWLIANEEGILPVVMSTVTGKPMKYDKLPWMKDSWLKGQRILKEVMIELGEIKSN